MSHYDCKECHQDPVSGHAPDCSRGKAMDELIRGDADLYDVPVDIGIPISGEHASARIMGDKDRENPVERPRPASRDGTTPEAHGTSSLRGDA